MVKRITLTEEEVQVLNYVLHNVNDDIEYDGSTDDYRDCGGIIVCFERDEYEAFKSILRKIK